MYSVSLQLTIYYVQQCIPSSSGLLPRERDSADVELLSGRLGGRLVIIPLPATPDSSPGPHRTCGEKLVRLDPLED